MIFIIISCIFLKTIREQSGYQSLYYSSNAMWHNKNFCLRQMYYSLKKYKFYEHLLYKEIYFVGLFTPLPGIPSSFSSRTSDLHFNHLSDLFFYCRGHLCQSPIVASTHIRPTGYLNQALDTLKYVKWSTAILHRRRIRNTNRNIAC